MKLEPHRSEIIQALVKGTPHRHLAKRLGVHWASLDEYIRENQIMKEVFAAMPRTIDNSIKYITPMIAQKIAKEMGIIITYVTLLNWVRDNELGFQPGGNGSRWYINERAWRRFLNGQDHTAAVKVR